MFTEVENLKPFKSALWTYLFMSSHENIWNIWGFTPTGEIEHSW